MSGKPDPFANEGRGIREVLQALEMPSLMLTATASLSPPTGGERSDVPEPGTAERDR
jgi:hypothetical protein